MQYTIICYLCLFLFAWHRSVGILGFTWGVARQCSSCCAHSRHPSRTFWVIEWHHRWVHLQINEDLIMFKLLKTGGLCDTVINLEVGLLTPWNDGSFAMRLFSSLMHFVPKLALIKLSVVCCWQISLSLSVPRSLSFHTPSNPAATCFLSCQSCDSGLEHK